MYVPRQVIQLLGFGANSWLRQGGELPINLGFRMHPSSGSKTTQTATTNNLEPQLYTVGCILYILCIPWHTFFYIYNINQYYTVLSLSFFVCGSDYPHDCCTVEGSGWEPHHLQSKWRELLLVKFKPHMYTLRPIKHPTWQLDIFSNRSTVYKYVLLILYIYVCMYTYIYNLMGKSSMNWVHGQFLNLQVG